MKLICMYAGSSAEKHTYTVHQSITGRKTGRNVNATVAANIGGTRKKDRELDGRCPRLASPRLALYSDRARACSSTPRGANHRPRNINSFSFSLDGRPRVYYDMHVPRCLMLKAQYLQRLMTNSCAL